ncbi:hypothetical protein RHS04_01121 [Rhizoctonia solani]|uniref:T6SS Phospholipase effector Tle1-like catalytic domain-containing protein n=1 Tax=Rhizoctonia solani TaxID=456999 RepID=A0A8H7HF17_9AGAM|nr:hypothetical protein RHS04_01121 [Rhizoctonia solani]
MAFEYRLALRTSYKDHVLAVRHEPDSIYVIASLRSSKLDKLMNDKDAEFNITPYFVLENNTLSFDPSGKKADHPKLCFKETYMLSAPGTQSGPTDNSKYPSRTLAVKVEVEEKPYEVTVALDNHLDVIEDYDPVSRQFTPRLGLKRKSSKVEHPSFEPTSMLFLPVTSLQRSIILCFDGTSNHFSNQNTNIIKLVELLKKDEESEQMVYYQPGVGTYQPPGLFTGVTLTVAAKLDEGVAFYLYQHIIDGYKYIMETYRAGDEINIFGFSRGAYTARALAGMLYSVGLLPRHNMEQVPFAYEVYAKGKGLNTEPTTKESKHQNDIDDNDSSSTIRRILNRVWKAPGPQRTVPPAANREYVVGAVDPNQEEESSTLSVYHSAHAKNVDPRRFKMVFCTPIEIKFLGVWDTVGSVGLARRKTLPFIEYNPGVVHFRQALALDETRGNFIPSVWDHLPPRPKRSALEVWFKGGHSDVGGGAPLTTSARRHFSLNMILGVYSTFQTWVFGKEDPNDKRPAGINRLPDLSNISLRWMVNECLARSDVRVLFDPFALHCYRRARILERHPTDGRPECEPSSKDIQRDRQILDEYDSRPKPYKSLNISPLFWWALELLPVPKLSQGGTDFSCPKTVYRPNLGKERSINIHPVGQLHNAIRIHYSAFKQIKDAGYQPEAKWYKLVNEGSLEIEDKPPLSTSSATESDLNITARKSDSLSIRESLKYWARLAFAYLVAFLLVFILWTAIIGVISQVRRLIESETLGALWEMARGVCERIFRLFSEQIYYLDSVSLEVF